MMERALVCVLLSAVLLGANGQGPTPPKGSGTFRCGKTWDLANAQCVGSCPGNTDAQCPPGLKCWKDLSVRACTPPSSKGSGTSRCGKTWDLANAQCVGSCPGNTDTQCPPGLKCWKDLSIRACSPPSSKGSGTFRCGKTWDLANEQCVGSCPGKTDDECPPGLKCWQDLSVRACSPPCQIKRKPTPRGSAPHAPPKPTEGTLMRLGRDLIACNTPYLDCKGFATQVNANEIRYGLLPPAKGRRLDATWAAVSAWVCADIKMDPGLHPGGIFGFYALSKEPVNRNTDIWWELDFEVLGKKPIEMAYSAFDGGLAKTERKFMPKALNAAFQRFCLDWDMPNGVATWSIDGKITRSTPLSACWRTPIRPKFTYWVGICGGSSGISGTSSCEWAGGDSVPAPTGITLRNVRYQIRQATF